MATRCRDTGAGCSDVAGSDNLSAQPRPSPPAFPRLPSPDFSVNIRDDEYHRKKGYRVVYRPSFKRA